ncbi:hypothetical protein [Mongoliimonas terrestris]|uniref:hypothetical protein n=1 Tax=Mongoliimonas terrestris TaxID=1709001 RepID=UPI00094967FB|nr:hypothetical protein [Mongoliimonas terrestris]
MSKTVSLAVAALAVFVVYAGPDLGTPTFLPAVAADPSPVVIRDVLAQAATPPALAEPLRPPAEAPAAEAPAAEVFPLLADGALPTGTVPAADPALAPATRAGGDVDETALHYFAREGDIRRLEAEAARLEALYPGWVRPADLGRAGGRPDPEIDRLWRLQARGQFAEVRQAIADRQAREPDWPVPEDLATAIRVGEKRQQLVAAAEAERWPAVLAVATETPDLLVCAEMNVLWHVATAFAATDQPGRAGDVYTHILTHCDNPAERLATLQKAAERLPRAALTALFALERPDSTGAPEFAALRAEIARSAIVAAINDPDMALADADRAVLEAAGRAAADARDALLLGWYHLKRTTAADAETWFRLAGERQPSAEAAEGLGLALIAAERPAEAEAVLYPHHAASEDLAKVYAAAVARLLATEPRATIEPPVIERIVQVVMATRNADLAQQVGWYAYALGQVETAGQWQATALVWAPDLEDAAFGLLIARQARDDKAGVAEIARLWAARSPRIAEAVALAAAPGRRAPQAVAAVATTGWRDATPAAYWPSAAGTAASAAGTAAEAAFAHMPTGSLGVLPAAYGSANGAIPGGGAAARVDDGGWDATAGGGQGLARGWSLMRLNRPYEALAHFERALGTGGARARQDAAYGLSLAYLRLGMTREAAAAAAVPQSAPRSAELEAAILADDSLAAFSAGAFRETVALLDARGAVAAETTDLMTLRGWAHYHMREFAAARDLFQAAAAAGHRPALEGLAALESRRPLMRGS